MTVGLPAKTLVRADVRNVLHAKLPVRSGPENQEAEINLASQEPTTQSCQLKNTIWFLTSTSSGAASTPVEFPVVAFLMASSPISERLVADSVAVPQVAVAEAAATVVVFAAFALRSAVPPDSVLATLTAEPFHTRLSNLVNQV